MNQNQDKSVYNFGIANPNVFMYPKAPYIMPSITKLNFEITADSWPMLKNSPFFPPLLMECAIDDEFKSFSVIYPSKRKYYIHNLKANVPIMETFIKGGNVKVKEEELYVADILNSLGDEPLITWTPISYKTATPQAGTPHQTVLTKVFEKFFERKETITGEVSKEEETGGETIEVYEEKVEAIAPSFSDVKMQFPALPNDTLTVNDFYQWMDGKVKIDKQNEFPENEPKAMWAVLR